MRLVLFLMLVAVTLLAGTSATQAQSAEGSRTASEDIGTIRRLLADMSVKLSAMDRQVRELNGRLEEMDFKNRSLEEALNQTQKQVLLLSSDLTELRAGSSSTSGGDTDQLPSDGPNPLTPGAAGPTSDAANIPVESLVALPAGTAQEQFDFAFSYIRRNELDTGGRLLLDIVTAHGKDPVVGNALFWLGRVGLQKEQPADAARHLLTLLDQFPNHPKKADAYVDLAAGLIELGASDDACDALFEYSRLDSQGGPRLEGRAARLSSEARCS